MCVGRILFQDQSRTSFKEMGTTKATDGCSKGFRDTLYEPFVNEVIGITSHHGECPVGERGLRTLQIVLTHSLAIQHRVCRDERCRRVREDRRERCNSISGLSGKETKIVQGETLEEEVKDGSALFGTSCKADDQPTQVQKRAWCGSKKGTTTLQARSFRSEQIIVNSSDGGSAKPALTSRGQQFHCCPIHEPSHVSQIRQYS